jgi:hypothetical protein
VVAAECDEMTLPAVVKTCQSPRHKDNSSLLVGTSLSRVNIPTQAKTGLEWATHGCGALFTDDFVNRLSQFGLEGTFKLFPVLWLYGEIAGKTTYGALAAEDGKALVKVQNPDFSRGHRLAGIGRGTLFRRHVAPFIQRVFPEVRLRNSECDGSVQSPAVHPLQVHAVPTEIRAPFGANKPGCIRRKNGKGSEQYQGGQHQSENEWFSRHRVLNLARTSLGDRVPVPAGCRLYARCQTDDQENSRVPHLSRFSKGGSTTNSAAELRSARTGEGARPHTAGGAAKSKSPALARRAFAEV